MRVLATFVLLAGGGCAASNENAITLAPPAPAGIEEWVSVRYEVGGADEVVLVEADFNDDGRRDWLVYLQSRDYCGTGGCTLLAVQSDGAGWKQIGRMPTTRPPFAVLGSKTNGYHDLAVGVGGGGGPVGTAKVPFVDGQYGPSTTSPPASLMVVDSGN